MRRPTRYPGPNKNDKGWDMGVRAAFAAMACAVLAACASDQDLEEPLIPIGDFRMGFNITAANEAIVGPFSREASEAELEEALNEAVERRLARYDGNGLYHVGARIEGYVLAIPGVPLVANPRSVMIIALQVWDDATQEKLTEEPVQIVAFEGLGNNVPLVPSGLVNTRDEQLDNLVRFAAREIEDFLRENEETWFAKKPGRTRTTFDRSARDRNGALIAEVQAGDTGAQLPASP